LKPEHWGSPLVQEKYQEEKACDKRHPYRIIVIIIIIIINKIKAKKSQLCNKEWPKLAAVHVAMLRNSTQHPATHNILWVVRH